MLHLIYQRAWIAGFFVSSLAFAKFKDLATIEREKVLHIATRDREGIALKQEGAAGRGFHLCLVDAFAKNRGVKVTVDWRPYDFMMYFAKDGVFNETLAKDVSQPFSPDIFKTNDIAVDIFSRLPWRERFADFVKIITTRPLIIYNKKTLKDPPKKPEDLKGRTLSVDKGTLQEELGKELAEKYQVKLRYIDKIGATGDKYDDLKPILSGKADILFYPSSYGLIDLKNNPEVGFAFSYGPVDDVNWLLPKGNDSLRTALENFLVEAQKNGVFDQCFKADFGIDYNSYLRSLSIIDAPKP